MRCRELEANLVAACHAYVLWSPHVRRMAITTPSIRLRHGWHRR